ncbi:MAG: NAD-dependent protein deacylase [Acidobacteria bacterium]|nr:MAG: NAD-dependent protein deacylase [Acidobacteriota bacterium]
MKNEESVIQIANTLRQSKRVLFITGAGISAESGIPTYRGVGGLYEYGKTEEGLSIETILSGHVFQRKPKLTWKYLFQIEKACRGAKPNRAHELIAEWQDRYQIWVLTQNVDGLHRKAGSRNIIEIHGSFHTLLCTDCDWRREVADYRTYSDLPLCPACGHVIRPDIVLFGEMLALNNLSMLQQQLNFGFDMVFSVGTSSLFPYITQPVQLARQQGIPTVEINPRETDLSRVFTHKLRRSAVEALTEIHKKL